MMMVTGSRTQDVRSKDNTRGKSYSRQSAVPKQVKKEIKKGGAKEINPEQLIPFDDEDDFKDF